MIGIQIHFKMRRGGRVVECTGLENRRAFIAFREFESHPLRHYQIDLIDSDVLFYINLSTIIRDRFRTNVLVSIK